MFRTLLFYALIASAGHALSATLIEVKTDAGMTKIYTDGSRSRIDSGKDGYMIVDNNAQTLFVVMPAERRVMDMSQVLRTPTSTGSNKPVKIAFNKSGSGPRIAGYPTVRYSYSADGHQCGTILASKQALEDTGLDDAFKTMEKMASRADAMMMTFNKNTDPCQRADTQFSGHVKNIGVPMRVTSAKGQLISEITRIDKKAKLPPNAFTIPAGYQVHDTGQMMQNAQKMMQQMQQSGQISPEALQQLRQMQQR